MHLAHPKNFHCSWRVKFGASQRHSEMKSLFLIFGVCQAKSKYHFTKRISATIDDTIYSVEGECDAACQDEKYKEAEEYLKNKVCQENFKKKPPD